MAGQARIGTIFFLFLSLLPDQDTVISLQCKDKGMPLKATEQFKMTHWMSCSQQERLEKLKLFSWDQRLRPAWPTQLRPCLKKFKKGINVFFSFNNETQRPTISIYVFSLYVVTTIYKYNIHICYIHASYLAITNEFN